MLAHDFPPPGCTWSLPRGRPRHGGPRPAVPGIYTPKDNLFLTASGRPRAGRPSDPQKKRGGVDLGGYFWGLGGAQVPGTDGSCRCDPPWAGHDLLYLAWLLCSRHDGYIRCVLQPASADVNVAASVRVVQKTRVGRAHGAEPQVPQAAVPIVEEASVAREPSQAAGWGCRVEITVKWRQRAKAKQTDPTQVDYARMERVCIV